MPYWTLLFGALGILPGGITLHHARTSPEWRPPAIVLLLLGGLTLLAGLAFLVLLVLCSRVSQE